MAGWTFGGHQQREYPHRGRSELGVECILIGWSITENRRYSAGHLGSSASAPAAARTFLLRRSAMLAEEPLAGLACGGVVAAVGGKEYPGNFGAVVAEAGRVRRCLVAEQHGLVEGSGHDQPVEERRGGSGVVDPQPAVGREPAKARGHRGHGASGPPVPQHLSEFGEPSRPRR